MANQRRVLIIQAHNLGDAVISTTLVETIAHGLPTAQIDVLTRPEIGQIFAHNPSVDAVFTGRFPMGSVHDFGLKEMLTLPRIVGTLRRRGYTDVVNLAGDFREEFLGRLITHHDNWSPAWSADHPCSKVIRRSAIRLANRPIVIPADRPNIYDAAAIMGTAITGAAAEKAALYTPAKKRIIWNPLERAVGIHPMASQPWRRWEMEKWQALAQFLIQREIDVHVFGSPSEAKELNAYFGRLDTSRISIVTGNLSDYFAAVSRMRVLLCPDSFASHVAFALGVPAILLNGANDAAAWPPPGTVVLAAGPELKCYPCYNRPTCFGSSDEYACVRRIKMDSVIEAVWEALKDASDNQHLFPLFQQPLTV
ncbi:glycosyltransferase family 9 protein [Granulicella arctica]|uniref:Heptosyltransferase-3 n=1 Tax=Granulicella arctica TaxID=940613 RepID=A0A7Y9PEA0_9BACT|nr:glycosyltransferase family 9 protein [Granulicella arctica]NYF78212.1 heptosyltransferase-3 [Granulicella arctica]